jgi:hypothetical protein
MSVRKMLLVCVLVTVTILPLLGCNGKTDKPAKSGPKAPSTNTTNAE